MGFRNRLVGLFRVAMLLSILGSLLMPLAQVSAAAAIGSDETSDVRVEGPADLDWVIQNPGGDYGYAVGTAGDVNGDGYADVIIGAPMVNPQTAVGQAFVYHGSATGLKTTPAWSVTGAIHTSLGWSVGTAGDVNGDGYDDVIVGEPHFTTAAGLVDAGRVSIFLGSALGLASSPARVIEGSVANAGFGLSVGTAGDVNNDGFSDVIVGAPLANGGTASVYHGSASGIGATHAWRIQGAAGTDLGDAVGTAGDVNGDYYDDVIIGVASAGEVRVYHGSASGLGVTPAWTVEDYAEGFGDAVGTAGDVNGDGYADVIIGAPYFSPSDYGDSTPGQSLEGRASVYLGSALGLGSTAAWAGEGNLENVQFGRSVGTAGDADGDGFADIVVGAPFVESEVGVGRVFVYRGSATGLGAAPAWSAEGPEGAQFGHAVGTAGDVNNDGLADVIVGAPWMSWAHVYQPFSQSGTNKVPHTLYGSVLINRVAPPAGSVLTVWAGSVQVGRATITSLGGVSRYTVEALWDNPDTPAVDGVTVNGQELRFKVGERMTDALAYWSEGANTELNIVDGEASSLIAVRKMTSGVPWLYLYNSPYEFWSPVVSQGSNKTPIPGGDVRWMFGLDHDGDGTSGIAAVKVVGGVPYLYIYSQPTSWEGASSAVAANHLPIPAGTVRFMFNVDYNGDGKEEIGVVKVVGGVPYLYIYSAPSGMWTPVSTVAANHLPIPGGNVLWMFGMDYNGDGKDEIACVKLLSDGARYLYIYSAPSGMWTPVSTVAANFLPIPGGNVQHIFAVDYDGDGKDEIGVIKVVDGSRYLYIYTAPSGMWTPVARVAANYSPIAAGDLLNIFSVKRAP